MRSVQKFVMSLLCLFLLVSCQREIEVKPSLPTPPAPLPPVTYIATTITGRIVAEDKFPVAGAVVSAGAQKAFTDVNGNFKLLNVSVDKNAAFVRVEKEGFFTGSRTFVTNSQKGSYVEVELIPRSRHGRSGKRWHADNCKQR